MFYAPHVVRMSSVLGTRFEPLRYTLAGSRLHSNVYYRHATEIALFTEGHPSRRLLGRCLRGWWAACICIRKKCGASCCLPWSQVSSLAHMLYVAQSEDSFTQTVAVCRAARRGLARAGSAPQETSAQQARQTRSSSSTASGSIVARSLCGTTLPQVGYAGVAICYTAALTPHLLLLLIEHRV